MLFRYLKSSSSARGDRKTRLRFESLEPKQMLHGEHVTPLVEPLPYVSQWLATDFALEDVNATSSTAGQTVSPRNYLGTVTGWYFGHAT